MRPVRRALISLSSATRMRPAASPAGSRDARSTAARSGPCRGTSPAATSLLTCNSNQKHEPPSGRGTKPASPPMISAMRLTIDRPSPDPPKRRVLLSSIWVNGANSSGRLSSGTPMPESSTSKRSRISPCGAGHSLPSMRMRPWSVNLTALLTRLPSIWRTRPASASSLRSSPCQPYSTSSPFCLARLRNRAAHSVMTCSGENGSATSCMRSASIRDRSSTSLSRLSSARPEPRMASANSRRSSSSRSLSSSNSAMPRIPFIGVRISCDMVARKRLFA